MKKIFHTVSVFCFIVWAFLSCSKGGNNYSAADHTVGLVNIIRAWSGTANGYIKGDTMYPGDTTHYAWPKAYSRVITDTTFPVQKVNGFDVSVLAENINYSSTDSVNKIVKFDTIISSGAPVSY